MSGVADRLRGHGLELPSPATALGAYVPAVRASGLVFTSGQLPMREGMLLASGRVGGEVQPGVGPRVVRVVVGVGEQEI